MRTVPFIGSVLNEMFQWINSFFAHVRVLFQVPLHVKKWNWIASFFGTNRIEMHQRIFAAVAYTRVLLQIPRCIEQTSGIAPFRRAVPQDQVRPPGRRDIVQDTIPGRTMDSFSCRAGGGAAATPSVYRPARGQTAATRCCLIKRRFPARDSTALAV
jgi:hypothetical protein